MHQQGIWFELFIRNFTLNLAGAAHDNEDIRCNQVSTPLDWMFLI